MIAYLQEWANIQSFKYEMNMCDILFIFKTFQIFDNKIFISKLNTVPNFLSSSVAKLEYFSKLPEDRVESTRNAGHKHVFSFLLSRLLHELIISRDDVRLGSSVKFCRRASLHMQLQNARKTNFA